MEGRRKCRFSYCGLLVQPWPSRTDRETSRQLCHQQTKCQGSFEGGETSRQLCHQQTICQRSHEGGETSRQLCHQQTICQGSFEGGETSRQLCHQQTICQRSHDGGETSRQLCHQQTICQRSHEGGETSRQLCHQQTICQGSRDMPQTGHTYRQLLHRVMFPRLSALAWLSSDTCSLDTWFARICVVLFVLILTMMPSSAAPVGTETLLAGVGAPPLGASCHAGFVGQLRECVQPFLSRVVAGQLEDSRTLVEHLCLDYQLALLCVHSALTGCPGLDNLRHVQATLGSHQVVQVNHVCSISSQSSTHRAEHKRTFMNHTHRAENKRTLMNHTHRAENKRTLMNHAHRPDFSGSTSSISSSGDIVQTPLQTTRRRHRHGVYSTVTHPQSPSPPTSPAPVTTRWPSDQEQQLDREPYDMQLNIYDFVNNYQYDKSPARDTEPSRTVLFQVMVETSAGGATQSNLTLMFVACVGWALAIH